MHMKRNKTKNRKNAAGILALFCASVLLLGVMSQPARAETAVSRAGAVSLRDETAVSRAGTVPLRDETAAEKYERLKGELEQIGEDIEGAKASKNAAEEAKVSLDEQKKVVEEMISLKQQEIAKTEGELAQKEEEIAQKRQVIYENDQLFQQRLVAIYKMNTATGLSQLFSVDSFAELMQMIDALQRISENDTSLLDLLEEQRQELEVQQQEIDGMLASLQTAHEELAYSADVLAGNIYAQEQAISAAEADVKAKEEAYEQKNDDLEKAQKEMEEIARQIAAQGSTSGDGSQYVGGVFVWPVPSSYNISCHFGSPDPNGTPHRGLDIHTNGAWGPPIVACGNGLVIISTYAGGSYGHYLVIDHGNGIKTLYAHCDQLLVNVGDTVTTGQQVATVGSTGFSTGPHLHLEVQTDGGLQNPLNYLRG